MAELDYLVAYGEEGLNDIRTGNALILEGVKAISDLNKQMKDVGFRRIQSDGLGQAKRDTDELTRLQVKYNQMLDESYKKVALLKQQIVEKNQELRNEAKQTIINQQEIEGNVNLYKKLNVELAKLRGEARQVGLLFGIESQQFKDTAASVEKLDTKLKNLDAALGQHQRSVGNYKAAWNGLGNSVQQMAREVPNFALSWTTGISAISNNLPILADEMAKVREQNKALIAEGKQGVPLWKQLGASILSWQTALVIGITAAIMWSQSQQKANKEAKEFNKTLKEGKDLTEDFAKAGSKDMTRLNELKSVIEDSNIAYSNRVKAVGELQKMYPEYFQNLTTEQILAGQVADAYARATDDILKKAAYTVLDTQLTESVERLLKAQKELEIVGVAGLTKMPNGQYDLKSIIDKYIKQGEQYNIRQYDAALRYNAALEEQKGILDDINKIQKGTSDLLGGNGNKGGSKSVKESKERFSLKTPDWKQHIKDVFSEMNDDLKILIEKAEIERNDSLAKINNQYASGVIKNKEDFETVKLGVEADFQRKSVEILLASLKKQSLIITNDGKSTLDIQKQISEAELKLTELDAKNKEKIEKTSREKQRAKIIGYLDELHLLIEFANKIASTINGIIVDVSKGKISELEHEASLIDQNGQKEIDRINKSTLTEEEKQRKIRAAEMRTDIQRKQIEQRIAQEKRKAAIAEKITGIGQTIASTVLAVMNELKDPKNIASNTEFIKAGIVGAMGAAQLARILATPLPKYAKGRKGGRGEYAVVGEQGIELVREKSGRSWLTGDSAHLAYLPSGAEVIPHHELIKNANYYVMQDIVKGGNNASQEHYLKEFLKQNLQSSRNIEKSINRLRNNTTINIDGSHNNYLINKLNR